MADGGRGFTVEDAPAPAIWWETDDWDASTIPQRPWIAPGYLLRGHVTTIIGPGGVSKSSLALAYVVALALGVDFHGLRPNGAFRSVVYNAEDDSDEQRRRLTAVLTSFGKEPSALRGKVARTGPNMIGTLFERDQESKQVISTPAMIELDKLIKDAQADVLFVDPLAELHTSEENSNGEMRSIVAAFRDLAKRRNIAVVIVHHTRKGIVAPGDPDSARGASSLIGASRIVLTLAAMTPEECKGFGLAETNRKHFFRVDGGKANYHALSDAEWFERTIFKLPNGDDVAVPVPWKPPVDVVSMDMRASVEAAIERGSSLGPWSAKLENRPRSIKHALVDAGIVTAAGQKDMLAILLRDGFEIAHFQDQNRKWMNGLRSPNGKPSNVTWKAG
jgi:hypothetical protein